MYFAQDGGGNKWSDPFFTKALANTYVYDSEGIVSENSRAEVSETEQNRGNEKKRENKMKENYIKQTRKN